MSSAAYGGGFIVATNVLSPGVADEVSKIFGAGWASGVSGGTGGTIDGMPADPV